MNETAKKRDVLFEELDSMENPFEDEYLLREIKWYRVKEYEKDGITLTTRSMYGRCDDFLNKNFRIGGVEFPSLLIDGKLWMSLTYMEIQSAYLAILFASGVCATAGLGMGYVPLRWAEKEDVESIDIYEIDDRVIKFFTEHFSDRPGFEKLNIIHGDVRKLMKEKDYDYVFMDPYDELLPNEVLTDIELFHETNNIGDYHFWGQEKVILAAVIEFDLHLFLNPFERKFFQMWQKSKASKMYQYVHDEDYVSKVIELLGR